MAKKPSKKSIADQLDQQMIDARASFIWGWMLEVEHELSVATQKARLDIALTSAPAWVHSKGLIFRLGVDPEIAGRVAANYWISSVSESLVGRKREVSDEVEATHDTCEHYLEQMLSTGRISEATS